MFTHIIKMIQLLLFLIKPVCNLVDFQGFPERNLPFLSVRFTPGYGPQLLILQICPGCHANDLPELTIEV